MFTELKNILRNADLRPQLLERDTFIQRITQLKSRSLGASFQIFNKFRGPGVIHKALFLSQKIAGNCNLHQCQTNASNFVTTNLRRLRIEFRYSKKSFVDRDIVPGAPTPRRMKSAFHSYYNQITCVFGFFGYLLSEL